MRTVFVLGLFAGCTAEKAPDPSVQSQQTGDTDNTPAPSSSGGLVWVDAEGVVVEGAVILPEGFAYLDEDGFVWRLFAATGELGTFTSSSASSIIYADAACTDPWLQGGGFLPRYVIGGDEGSRAPIDGAMVEVLDPAYQPNPYGDCVNLGPVEGLSPSDTTPVGEPIPTWSGPLHPELR